MRSSASALGTPQHFVFEFVLRFRKAKQSDVIMRRRGCENLYCSVRKNTLLPRGHRSFTMINTTSQSSGKYIAGKNK